MNVAAYLKKLERIEPCRWSGRVTGLTGLLVESDGPAAAAGDLCEVISSNGGAVRAQVVGFRNGRLLSMLLEDTGGIQPGAVIVARPAESAVPAGPQLLGRILDGFGRPMDGL